MAEYIERGAVLEEICRYCRRNWPTVSGVEAIIKNQTAADVEPVRHGRWIEDTYDQFFKYDKHGAPVYRKHITYTCSNDYCKIKMLVKFPYCPNCGAKMNGGAVDAAD